MKKNKSKESHSSQFSNHEGQPSELERINQELAENIKQLKREVHVRKEFHNLYLLQQQKFKNFIEQSSEGVAIVEPSGRIVEWNTAMTQITGIKISDALKSNIKDINIQLLPEGKRVPKNIERLKEATQNYLKNISQQQPFRMEGEVLLANGESKVVSNVFFPIKQKNNSLVGIVSRDITQQKRTENELKQFKENLEEMVKQQAADMVKLSGFCTEIFNRTSDCIALISTDFKLLRANPALQQLLGIPEDELYTIGSVFNNIPTVYHEAMKKAVENLMAGETLSIIETELILHSGERRPVELTANLMEQNNEVVFLSIIRDISKRRELENAIMLKTIEVEERERRRFAADLHDDIGPLLASLKMYISVLEQKLLETEHSHVLEIVQRILKNSIDNVRLLSNNISPHLLDRYGLISAISADIENFKMLVPVHFETNLTGKMFQKQIEVVVYRIIKELFNNSLKHAKASQINLHVVYRKSILYIKFTDDGVGYDPKSKPIDRLSGHGLPNIENRIKSINGNYAIETSPGNGFVFLLDVPIKLR